MSTARTPQGRDRLASLSRANNDERRWFAAVHQRFQVYIRRMEAFSDNIETTVEQFDELIQAITQTRANHTLEWQNMHSDMLDRGRDDAAEQTQARWQEFLQELDEANARLVELRNHRFPPDPVQERRTQQQQRPGADTGAVPRRGNDPPAAPQRAGGGWPGAGRGRGTTRGRAAGGTPAATSPTRGGAARRTEFVVGRAQKASNTDGAN